MSLLFLFFLNFMSVTNKGKNCEITESDIRHDEKAGIGRYRLNSSLSSENTMGVVYRSHHIQIF